MVDVEETKLPGVGVRHDFQTEDGRRLGVITHHGGRKELLVYSEDDPDACSVAVSLSPAESAGMTELLGGSQVHEALDQLHQQVDGLTIDWVHVHEGWWCVGRTIRGTELRERTGVSIVALLVDGTTMASPDPDQPLGADDTVVVVAAGDRIAAGVAHLRDGP